MTRVPGQQPPATAGPEGATDNGITRDIERGVDGMDGRPEHDLRALFGQSTAVFASLAAPPTWWRKPTRPSSARSAPENTCARGSR